MKRALAGPSWASVGSVSHIKPLVSLREPAGRFVNAAAAPCALVRSSDSGTTAFASPQASAEDASIDSPRANNAQAPPSPLPPPTPHPPHTPPHPPTLTNITLTS